MGRRQGQEVAGVGRRQGQEAAGVRRRQGQEVEGVGRRQGQEIVEGVGRRRCRLGRGWCYSAWERLAGDMNAGPGGLSDLLDLGSLLADDGAALAARHQQVEVQVQVLLGVLPLPAAAALALVPQLPLLQDLADQGVRLRAAVKTIKKK